LADQLMATPLRYPADWPKVVGRHFLLGLPLVGAQASVYRELREQLSLRTIACWQQWGASATRIDMAQFLAMQLGRAADWPNPIFIPDDPFILAAWDHDSCVIDDLAVLCAFDAVSEHAGIPRRSIDWSRFANSSVGEVVDHLLHASNGV
jgi:hypothetical protein